MPDANGGKVTNIIPEQMPGLVARAKSAARYVITGVKPDTWNSPLQPLIPIQGQGATGRKFNFKAGYNLNNEPRADSPITFWELRALAQNCDIVRLAIETRKDQVEAIEWAIGSRDDEKANADSDERIAAITQFLQYPDKINDWNQWIRSILEDLFVLDAPSIYRRKTKGGDLYALQQIDGGTIKPLIDESGLRPIPPDPAYQQYLIGVPKNNYTADELIYPVRNPRAYTMYGFGPVEQIMLTANIALRREVSQLQFFSEGNVPAGLIGVPKEWTADECADYQKEWDAMLAGNTGNKQKLFFIPGDPKYTAFKAPPLKDEFDEWLARIVCYAFSLPPTPFVKQMNRATGDTAQEAALQEGLAPILGWIKRLIDRIIREDFNAPDLEFNWSIKDAQDPVDQATVETEYVKAGVKSVDEVRDRLGLDKIGGAAAIPMLATPTGYVPLDAFEQQMEQQKAETDATNAHAAATLAVSGNDPGTASPGAAGADKAPKDGASTGDKKPKGRASKKGAIPLPEGRSGLDSHDPLTLRKAGGHEPIPFDHPAATKAKAAINATMKGALATALENTLDYLQKNKLGKLAKAKPKNPDDPDEPESDQPTAEQNAAAAEAIADNIDLSSLQVIASELEIPLTDVADAVGNMALAQLNIKDPDSLTSVNERAADWASDHAAELVSQLEDTTRDNLKDTITAALDEGWSHDELVKELTEEYSFSDARAELIATTETNNANNMGALQGYLTAQKNGVDVKKQWWPDVTPCPICLANAAEGPIALEDNFLSGDAAPTAHPNCLCALIPVVQDAAK